MVIAIALGILSFTKFRHYVTGQAKIQFEQQMSLCDSKMAFFDQKLDDPSEEIAKEAIWIADDAIDCYEIASYSGNVDYQMKDAKYKAKFWRENLKNIRNEKFLQSFRREVIDPYTRFENSIKKTTRKIRER